MSLSKYDQTNLYQRLNYIAERYPQTQQATAQISFTVYLMARCGRGINISSEMCAISYLAYRYFDSLKNGSQHRIELYKKLLQRFIEPDIAVMDEFDSVRSERYDWSNQPAKQASLARNFIDIYDQIGHDAKMAQIMNGMLQYLNSHLNINNSLIYVDSDSHSCTTDTMNILHKLVVYSAVHLENVNRKRAYFPATATERGLYDNLCETIKNALAIPAPVSCDEMGKYHAPDNLIKLLKQFCLDMPSQRPLKIELTRSYKLNNNEFLHFIRVGHDHYVLFQTNYYDFDQYTKDSIVNSGHLADGETLRIITPVDGGCYDPNDSSIDDSSVYFKSTDSKYNQYALFKVEHTNKSE